jgi:tetratricopeptide (TPR) repeat protein
LADVETGSTVVDQDLQSQIAYFESKRQLSPDSRVFAPLADLYRRAERFDDALRVLEEGLERHPDFVSALVVLGRVHVDREDPDAARAAWQKVMAVDPENLVALRQLAVDASEREAWRPAVRLWERYVRLNPVDEDAEDRLRKARAELEASAPPPAGDSQTPEETPPPAPAEPPSGGSPALRNLATKTLAEIFLAQGYRDKAIAVLEEILEHDPERQDVSVRLEEIRGERGSARAGERRAGPGELAMDRSDAGGKPDRPADRGEHGARRRTSERAAEREQFEDWIARIRQRQEGS